VALWLVASVLLWLVDDRTDSLPRRLLETGFALLVILAVTALFDSVRRPRSDVTRGKSGTKD